MKEIWIAVVKTLAGNAESCNINEAALIIVLICLLTALLISIAVARKNHLYNRPAKKEEQYKELEHSLKNPVHS